MADPSSSCDDGPATNDGENVEPAIGLDIHDVVTTTHEKLLNLAKHSEQLQITMIYAVKNDPAVISVKPELTMKDLEFHFLHFGNFVKHLTLQALSAPLKTECLRSLAVILKLCPNLETLIMQEINFANGEAIQILRNIASSVTRLELRYCDALPADMLNTLKCIKNLKEFTFFGRHNNISATVFERMTNLCGLSIDIRTLAETKRIFDVTGSRLQRLKLMFPSESIGLSATGQLFLLIDKMPRLERLEVAEALHYHLLGLPHLKSLHLDCLSDPI